LSGISPLDRSSAVPLYVQLGEVLKAELESGTWWPGARFPTEREIGDHFEVSRTVIRPAFDLLVADGAIVRIKGKGTFVAPPKLKVPAVGILAALLDCPDELGIQVLSTRREAVSPAVAEFLETTDDSMQVGRVSATIHVQGQPVGLIVSHSLLDLVPWVLNFAEGMQPGTREPPQETVELGLTATSIEGSFLGEWSASRLGVRAGDPAFLGRLIQFGRPTSQAPETPLEFARLVYRSDNTRLTYSENPSR
jgi:GntR family transcriptional regulator